MGTASTLENGIEVARSMMSSAKREELLAIIRAARKEVQRANPTNRDLEAELIAERRAEAERE